MAVQQADVDRSLSLFVQQQHSLAVISTPWWGRAPCSTNTAHGLDRRAGATHCCAPRSRPMYLVQVDDPRPVFAAAWRSAGASAEKEAGRRAPPPTVHIGRDAQLQPDTLAAALQGRRGDRAAARAARGQVGFSLLACAAKENFTLYVAMLRLTLALMQLTSWAAPRWPSRSSRSKNKAATAGRAPPLGRGARRDAEGVVGSCPWPRTGCKPQLLVDNADDAVACSAVRHRLPRCRGARDIAAAAAQALGAQPPG